MEPTVFRMQVMLFGVKSSPSSAIFIKNKNARSFYSEYPISSDKIIKNHCMDDYLDSCQTVVGAAKRVKELTIINRHAGFELHKWASNVRSV